MPVHSRKHLAALGIRPKKRFGQNFLVDERAARRIAQLSLTGASPGARVLEIGAGTGALTQALLEEGASLTAIEIDPELASSLRRSEDISNACILEADALAFDYAAWSAGAPWIVAANLPYNIATPIIVRLAEMKNGPESMTVMVQKDVADRLVARPGTSAYGSLSVAIAYAMEAQRAFTLRPSAFYPTPNVQSAVVRLVRRAQPAVDPRDPQLFWKVVRGAFAYRRKTLANSLSLALDMDRAKILLRYKLATYLRSFAVNDSTLPTSPVWPTSWPADSFKGIWTWLLAGFIALIFIATFFLGLAVSQKPAPHIGPLLLDVSIIAQFVLESILVAIVLVALPHLSKFSLKELGFRTPTSSTYGIAFLGAIAMVVFANGGASLIDHLAHSQHEQDIIQIVRNIHDPASITIFVVFAVIFAPFAEETFFRLLFFNLGLRYGGFWCGAILSGVLFGIAHGDIYAALPLAVGGIVLCGVYYLSRNAYASMMSHACFNALSIAALLIGPHFIK